MQDLESFAPISTTLNKHCIYPWLRTTGTKTSSVNFGHRAAEQVIQPAPALENVTGCQREGWPLPARDPYESPALSHAAFCVVTADERAQVKQSVPLLETCAQAAGTKVLLFPNLNNN